jgi:glutamine amidotransferase-like uncharacterized protein
VRPYLEKTPHKNKAGLQGEGPEFKPQFCKNKKQNKIKQKKQKRER